MKRILMLIACYTISIMAHTQQNFQDIIFLKNGEKKKGIIYEQIPFSILRIVTAGGDSLEYQTDEIEKLVRKPDPCGKSSSDDNTWQKTGYQCIIEMGVSNSLPPNDFTAYFKLNLINGYRFNPWLFLGCGIGLRYPYLEKNSYIIKAGASPVFNDFGMPVFIDARVNLCFHKIKPFLALSSGYSFDMRNNDPETREKKYSLSQIRGVGLILSPTAGVTFIFSDRYGISVGVSYELQKFKEYLDGYNYYSAEMVTTSNSKSINIGLTF